MSKERTDGMNKNEASVYDFLRSWKSGPSMSSFVEERSDLTPSQKEERLELLEKASQMLETLMRLLDDDERFIVKRHLIDGIPWNRVVYEYNHLLKRPAQRSYSSLRRMQHQGILKIAREVDRKDQGCAWCSFTLAIE